MTICYVIPGLGGTSLGTSAATADDTWVSYTAFAFGAIGRMRLAPDGVSPGPPDGVRMYPGYLLPDYYGHCLSSLTAQLTPLGYTVTPYPYDWRLDARTSGAALATAIQSSSSAGSPCVIVAHSFGGLVARVAWSLLFGLGKSALVRRIITLGSPHWGSYGVVRFWSGDSDQLYQVYYLSTASSILLATVSPLIAGRAWSVTDIESLGSTWPSLYQTLPSLLAPDAGTDPLRSSIYNGFWPPNRSVSASRLADAVATWQPLMAGASTQPPPGIMTTVAGSGLPTVDHLILNAPLGNPGIYSASDTGDGTVTTSASILSTATQIQVVGAHGNLPNQTASSGQLAQWITSPPPPPGPPPPAIIVSGQLGVVIAGPPSPQPIAAATVIPRDP